MSRLNNQVIHYDETDLSLQRISAHGTANLNTLHTIVILDSLDIIFVDFKCWVALYTQVSTDI